MSASTQSLVGVVDLGGNGDLALTVCLSAGLDPSVWVQFDAFDFDLADVDVLRAVGGLFAAAADELEAA